MVQFFVNEKTGRKFKVLEFDQANGKIKLQGDLGTFTEAYDKAQWKALGYKLVNEPDAEPSPDDEEEGADA